MNLLWQKGVLGYNQRKSEPHIFKGTHLPLLLTIGGLPGLPEIFI